MAIRLLLLLLLFFTVAYPGMILNHFDQDSAIEPQRVNIFAGSSAFCDWHKLKQCTIWHDICYIALRQLRRISVFISIYHCFAIFRCRIQYANNFVSSAPLLWRFFFFGCLAKKENWSNSKMLHRCRTNRAIVRVQWITHWPIEYIHFTLHIRIYLAIEISGTEIGRLFGIFQFFFSCLFE